MVKIIYSIIFYYGPDKQANRRWNTSHFSVAFDLHLIQHGVTTDRRGGPLLESVRKTVLPPFKVFSKTIFASTGSGAVMLPDSFIDFGAM